MKHYFFFLVLLCLGLISCNKEDGDDIVNVKLNPTFLTLDAGKDIQMKSLANTEPVIYAIQVYEDDIPYYYGLFNDVSKMDIALTTSKKYKFKVSAYKDGTGEGLKVVTDTAGSNYFLPNKLPLKNKFLKGDFLKDIDLPSSIVLNGQAKDYSEVDAFYASKSLTLDKGMTSIDFPLLRMGFGLNFTVDALTSGNMEIYIGNDTLKLDNTVTSAYTVRQFNSTSNSFENIFSNADTFGDSISISAKWTSKSGTIVMATKKYKFVRNYQKVINIELNTITNYLSFEVWRKLTDNLIAWYPFNGNANDESGNGNNGIITGATLTTDRFGNSNKAYYFNGLSNYISTNCYGPAGTSERTFSFWAQSSSNSNNSIVLDTGGGEAGGCFSVALDYPSSTFNVDINNALKTYTADKAIFDTWHLYTVVLPKAATPKLSDVLMYIDGKLLSNFTYYNGTSYNINTASSRPITIGRSPGYSNIYSYQYFKGKLDEIGIWNRALSQDEITDLYNAK